MELVEKEESSSPAEDFSASHDCIKKSEYHQEQHLRKRTAANHLSISVFLPLILELEPFSLSLSLHPSLDTKRE